MTAPLLLATLCLAGLATAAPEAATPPAPADAAAQPARAELTLAERNYILETLARTIEGSILMIESPLSEHKPEQWRIILLERELHRRSASPDGLSPAQQQLHNAELELLKSTIERTRQAPEQHKQIFQELLDKSAQLRESASEECLRLFDESPATQRLIDEIQLKQRYKSIADLLSLNTEGEVSNKAEAIKQLKALVADIRALKR